MHSLLRFKKTLSPVTLWHISLVIYNNRNKFVITGALQNINALCLIIIIFITLH